MTLLITGSQNIAFVSFPSSGKNKNKEAFINDTYDRDICEPCFKHSTFMKTEK